MELNVSEELNYVQMTKPQTVRSPLFFRKVIEIERFALRAAILHECQNYLIPDARPLGTFENHDTRNGKTWFI